MKNWGQCSMNRGQCSRRIVLNRSRGKLFQQQKFSEQKKTLSEEIYKVYAINSLPHFSQSDLIFSKLSFEVMKQYKKKDKCQNFCLRRI